jgi:hypothetical protein
MRRRMDHVAVGHGGMVPLESLLDRNPASCPEVAVSPVDVGTEAGAIIASLRAPAEMLAAMVRAYAVALLKKPGARTAEDRSRILTALRELLDDAVLDAVRDVRLPEGSPTPPPGEARPRGS